MSATPQQLRDATDKRHLAPFLRAVVTSTSNNNGPRALYVAYIDARAVAHILDSTLGPESWSFSLLQAPMYQEKSWMAHGRLTVRMQDGTEIHREDVGTNDNETGQTGGKGAASDTLKRCAAQLGVGRALSYLPQTWERGKLGRNNKVQADDEAAKLVIARWAQILDKPAAAAAASPVANVDPGLAEAESIAFGRERTDLEQAADRAIDSRMGPPREPDDPQPDPVPAGQTTLGGGL